MQVTKDPLPNKGARVTTQVTFPGRFVVFLPTVSHVGVSRKIEDEEERLRLRELLESIPHGAAGAARMGHGGPAGSSCAPPARAGAPRTSPPIWPTSGRAGNRSTAAPRRRSRRR